MVFQPFSQVTPVLSSLTGTGHSLWVQGRSMGWALRGRGESGELLEVCVHQILWARALEGEGQPSVVQE